MTEAEKRKAIDLALVAMDKQFGKGTVLRLGANNAVPVQVISSGCLSIDAALGVGGFPRGRVVEIFGPESSGKTTLALQLIAQAQKNGGVVAFIDAEHALDPIYARKLGVDIDNLLVSQPDTGEQALEITAALVTSGAIDVAVIDSVAALVPKAELEGEMGDNHVGLHARLMSQALRKLTGMVARTNTCMVFINQIREKIGVMFGSPETTTGGRALKFYSSVRIDIRRIAAIKDGESVIGNRTRVKVVKNKVASPFKEAEFDILYGEGTSREGDLIDIGVAKNVVEKSGSWFSYRRRAHRPGTRKCALVSQGTSGNGASAGRGAAGCARDSAEDSRRWQLPNELHSPARWSYNMTMTCPLQTGRREGSLFRDRPEGDARRVGHCHEGESPCRENRRRSSPPSARPERAKASGWRPISTSRSPISRSICSCRCSSIPTRFSGGARAAPNSRRKPATR